MDSKHHRQQAEEVFTKRIPLLSLWQEEAEHFYPERADFTYKRYLGNDWAANLMTSYPCLCRRDLGDQFGTMLRNVSKPWFSVVTNDPRREDAEAKAWMQWATGLQRRVMYDTESMFDGATKLGDHDFSAFGQNVIHAQLNRMGNGVIYRTHHLRDVVWVEDEDGKICAIYRKCKLQAYWLMQNMKPTPMKPNRSVHEKVIKLAQKKPFETVECLHMVMRAELFDGSSEGKPWREIYYDCDNKYEMESVATWTKGYIISRWVTMGSQYAHSPATVIALPEARLLQAMTYTLLEAGEKIVNPPMVATETAVRSDMAVYAGGVTWVEYDYDERLGQAIRPLTTDAKGMPLSQEMQRDSRNLISQCFYLNKLRPFLPSDKEMTAYQASQVVSQYVRDALPLFAPMEAECNGGLCQETFDLIWHARGFGPLDQIPKSLQGADIGFRFASPLHDAIEQLKGQTFAQLLQLTTQAMSLDKTAISVPKVIDALRDACDGIGVPQKWVRSEVEVKAMQAQEQAQQEQAQALEAMQGGANVAATLSTAAKDSGLTPQAAAA